MAITYAWKITGLRKQNINNLNDVIVQTYWQKTGTDEEGNQGTFSGATPFNPSQIDPNNFTSYENLTEEQVLGWVQSYVTGLNEDHVNNHIQKDINNKKNPIETIGELALPWIKQE